MESSRLAWLAACELWPEEVAAAAEVDARDAGARRAWTGGSWQPLTGDTDGLPNWLLAKMAQLRPVLSSDGEAVLLVRLCADEAVAAEQNRRTGSRPLSVGEILTNWGAELRDTLLARYGLPPEVLSASYARARDAWVATDPAGWAAANVVHADAAAALRQALSNEAAAVHVVTEKPSRYAIALLEQASVGIGEGSVHGQEQGSTLSVLAELRRGQPDARLSLIEASVPRLREVANSPALFGTELWFAAWGHSTPQQQALVSSMPRVQVLLEGGDLRCVFETRGGGSE